MLFNTCSKLAANFALCPVLSRGYAHAQLSSFHLLSTFGAFHVTKIPGSPRLHNFNVRVPECGSLGTRSRLEATISLVSCSDPSPKSGKRGLVQRREDMTSRRSDNLDALITFQGQERGVRHGASRRTRFRNPLDFKWISDFRMDFWISKWISDFKMDFWISKWISGFQSGFLDFKVDFWISKWISGFQSGFLDFKADFCISKWISRGISGFQANFWISKRISGFQSGFLEGFLDLKRISGFHLNRYY